MTDGDEAGTDTATMAPAGAIDPSGAPGGQAALRRGCLCSVLANAAFRAGHPGVGPFVDPGCPVHRVP